MRTDRAGIDGGGSAAIDLSACLTSRADCHRFSGSFSRQVRTTSARPRGVRGSISNSGRGSSLEDRRNEIGLRLARERSRACDQLVKHDAEGEDVAARVSVMALDLLRRHVGQRAQEGAFRRQRSGWSVHDAGAVDSKSVRDLRESEIENLHAALGAQDVAGLQVAVDDALFVRGVERVQDLPGQFERLSERHRSVQPLALDVLHDEVVGADVVERTDMRMVYRRDGPRLTFKALTERAETRLDGDQSIRDACLAPSRPHPCRQRQGQRESRTDRAAYLAPEAWRCSGL